MIAHRLAGAARVLAGPADRGDDRGGGVRVVPEPVEHRAPVGARRGRAVIAVLPPGTLLEGRAHHRQEVGAGGALVDPRVLDEQLQLDVEQAGGVDLRGLLALAVLEACQALAPATSSDNYQIAGCVSCLRALPQARG